MAHTTRAILLANATATTLRGRRCTRACNHALPLPCSGLTYLTTAVAPFTSNARSCSLPFARDLAQPVLAGGGVLLRRQTEPGGEVPARLELPRINRRARVKPLTGPMPGTSANCWLSELLLCSAASLVLFGNARRYLRQRRAEFAEHRLCRQASTQDRRQLARAEPQRSAFPWRRSRRTRRHVPAPHSPVESASAATRAPTGSLHPPASQPTSPARSASTDAALPRRWPRRRCGRSCCA